LDAIRRRRADMLGDLPAVLAFDGTQERLEVTEGLLARFGPNKVLVL
jgi:hypothetical protein